MKRPIVCSALLTILLMGISAPALAQTEENNKITQQADLQYRAPSPSAPKSRVRGSSRGLADGSIAVSVLTPEQSGLTTQELPTLYWYLSHVTTIPIELTVIEDQAVEPILETLIKVPHQSGVQQIRLTDYGVRLKPGIEYRWFVAVVPDPENRSKDVLSGGIIERIEISARLRERLTKATAEQLPFVYAQEGIWYDALSAISERIDATPENAQLRGQRAALLEQVRLQEVADLERRTVR